MAGAAAAAADVGTAGALVIPVLVPIEAFTSRLAAALPVETHSAEGLRPSIYKTGFHVDLLCGRCGEDYLRLEVAVMCLQALHGTHVVVFFS